MTIKRTAEIRRRTHRNTGADRLRLGFWLIIITVTWLVVVGRLWMIQIVSGKRYAEITERQTSGAIPLPAERGGIYDRFGREVALNVVRHSLWVYPQSKEEVVSTGRYLDNLFGYSHGVAQKKFNLEPLRFRWIERGVSDKIAAKVESDSPAGVFVRKERGREYPYGLVGKQILGFTDTDNKGISGLESRYDEHLRGTDGVADIRKDGLRNIYQVKERPVKAPQPGGSIILTVDWELQEVVESELRSAVEQYNAVSGDALFVDCRTGEILSAAHYSAKTGLSERPTKLPPITDSFEPGSIYKIITAAAILDNGIAGPRTKVFCENGRWRCGRMLLRDDKELDTLTFHQAISLSSNIGVGKLAVQLGGEELVSASRRFGIAQKSRVDFPGEQRGMIGADRRWSDYDIAAFSIGHSVTVTPLQMALAMATIANGGKLCRPRFVRGLVSANGYRRDIRKPEIVADVISEKSTRALRSMLESVVDSGTATEVISAIAPIAGKTGTAEIPREDGKGYHKNKFIASFAGYFPVDSPQVAGIVILRQPEPIHYGGYTSGPAFKRIAEQYTLAHPGRFAHGERQLVVNEDFREQLSKVPNLIGMTNWAGKEKAKRSGFRLKGALADGDIIWQFPVSGELGAPGSVIAAMSVTDIERSLAEGVARNQRTPDLIGLSTRQAALLLTQLGMQFDLQGSGKILSQRPEPGRIIDKGEALKLECQSLAKLNTAKRGRTN